MTTQLRPKKPNARGVRKILCTQIDDAATALKGKRVTDEEVHTARKSIKKARATLRLLRDSISNTAYRRENVALRDAARPISAIRDAKILIDSLDRLVKLYGPAARQSIPPAFRRALNSERNSMLRQTPRGKGTRAARSSLLQAKGRVTRLKIASGDWECLSPSLKRVYAQGRSAMKKASKDASPPLLHEWRKQTKYLWHQLQILSPLWPGPIGELADQAHQLADYLGDDHDLAVLREKVLAHSQRFDNPGGPDALLALIDRCQEQLRTKAFVLGARIFAEKPATFVARFGRYFRRWLREQPARSQR